MNMRLRFTIESSYRQVIMSTSGSGERLNAEIGRGSSGTFPCAPVRTALLVEDVPEFARGISEAVAGLCEGWRAEHVASGTDALRVIADSVGVFSLVLVDLELPDMSGVDVIRAARRALLAGRACDGPDSFARLAAEAGAARAALRARLAARRKAAAQQAAGDGPGQSPSSDQLPRPVWRPHKARPGGWPADLN
jgi:CheY-like chemotaxis protein